MFFYGPVFDQFMAHVITESWSLRDANRALRRDGDFRFDEVFCPVALAGRNIAGQRVAGKRGNSNIVSAADAAFKHAAAPGWNIPAKTIGLNVASTGVSADAA